MITTDTIDEVNRIVHEMTTYNIDLFNPDVNLIIDEKHYFGDGKLGVIIKRRLTTYNELKLHLSITHENLMLCTLFKFQDKIYSGVGVQQLSLSYYKHNKPSYYSSTLNSLIDINDMTDDMYFNLSLSEEIPPKEYFKLFWDFKDMCNSFNIEGILNYDISAFDLSVITPANITSTFKV